MIAILKIEYIYMYVSHTQRRIGVAIIVGAAIIAGALLLRTDNATPQSATNTADTVVAVAPARQAIPVTDADGNGIPDWQEQLVETTPVDIATSSTYTEPDTLTGQFSQQLFENIMRNKSAGSFGESMDQLITNATQSLTANAVDTLYTATDIKLSPNNSTEALANYGEAIAYILMNQNDTTGENEAALLQKAIAAGDRTLLAPLQEKMRLYKNVIEQTKALPVPSTLASEHLALINAYQAIYTDITAMYTAFDDPMNALLRIKRYEDDALGLKNAYENLYNGLYDRGARWESNSVVYNLITIQ